MFSLDLILIMLAVGALVGHAHRRCSARPSSLQVAASRRAPRSRCWPWSARASSSGSTPAPSSGSATASWSASRASSPSGSPPSSPGRIRLAGEIWSAAPYDENLTIEPGETVEVFEIRGATAYVHPVPAPRVLTRDRPCRPQP